MIFEPYSLILCHGVDQKKKTLFPLRSSILMITNRLKINKLTVVKLLPDFILTYNKFLTDIRGNSLILSVITFVHSKQHCQIEETCEDS